MTGRERFFALLSGSGADRLPVMPVTMLFAADQIGIPYGRYALDCNVLVEAQLRTAEKFGFDHVSAITETREARDCGATLRYFDDQPYAIDEAHARLSDKKALGSLYAPDPRTAPAMSDRLNAIRMLRSASGATRVVEGWVEGPCGAASDLRGIGALMLDFYDDPVFVRELFEFVVQLAIRFGRAQVEAGADLIGIGDPAASLVGPRLYREFVLPFERRLAAALREAGVRVRLHICGNTRPILPDLARLECDIVDIDSAVSARAAREGLGPGQVLLGGIDPVRVLQQGSPADVTRALEAFVDAAGPMYIVGAGCEIPRGTPPENVRAMAEFASRAVRE
jgi:MtaA/CmuA family methyltransferase